MISEDGITTTDMSLCGNYLNSKFEDINDELYNWCLFTYSGGFPCKMWKVGDKTTYNWSK